VKHADRDAIADRDRRERLTVRAVRNRLDAPQRRADVARERGEVALVSDEEIARVGGGGGEQARGFRRKPSAELVAPALFAGQTAITVANAMRLDRSAIGIVTTGVITNIVLNAMIIPQWGAIGAAYTTVATESLIAVGLVLVIERRLKKRIGAQADSALSPELQP